MQDNKTETNDDEIGVIYVPESESESEQESEPDASECEPPNLSPNYSSFNIIDEKRLLASLKTKLEKDIYFVSLLKF